MERTDEAITEDFGRQEPASRERFACIHYNQKRDLPMLLAVRNATFICNGQLYEQLASMGSETTRRGFNWRLLRLVRAGLVEKLPPTLPYPGAVYRISRSGLACLEACGEGLMSLTSESKTLANLSQIQHYLELGEIQAAFRSMKLLKDWTGDLEIRSLNQSIDTPLAKDYDAIAELEVDGCRYRIALEYERFLKSTVRYGEILAAIKDEDQIDLLLYLTSSIDLLYQLKAEFDDHEFPIALVTSRTFCSNPAMTRMYLTASLGGNKATIAEALQLLPRRERARLV